jgi:hypothetical protein
MKIFFLILLIFLSIYPFFSLKKDKTKLYQLPCLFGLVTLGYIVPQLFISLNILEDDVYILYAFNACLCLLTAYIGYAIPIKKIGRTYQYNEKRMLISASVFFFIGIIIYANIGEYQEESMVGGWYAVLIFFARWTRPAIFIILFLYLRKKSNYKLLLILIWVSISMYRIIVLGRRSDMFLLILTVALPLFFVKGFIPYKKIYLITALIVGIGVFVLFPVFRTYTMQGGFESAKNINYNKVLSEYFAGEGDMEVPEAAKNMYVVKTSEIYEYGAKFYNYLVYQYVSTTLFGEGLKDKLFIGGRLKSDYDSIRSLFGKNGWGGYLGYMPQTGYGDAFLQFGFLGCALFFIFARIAKKVFYNAYYTDDIMRKIFYSYFVILIVNAIYDSMTILPLTLVFYLWVYLPVKYFSKIR